MFVYYRLRCEYKIPVSPMISTPRLNTVATVIEKAVYCFIINYRRAAAGGP